MWTTLSFCCNILMDNKNSDRVAIEREYSVLKDMENNIQEQLEALKIEESKLKKMIEEQKNN